MKKKVLTLVLALALVLSMAVPAMAVPTTVTTHNGTGATIMTYNVAQAFTVTIPEAVTINSDKTGTLTVGVAENAFIEHDKSILVKLTTCDFKLTCGDDDLAYTIKDHNLAAVTLNGTVLTHPAGTLTASSEVLSLAVTDSAKYSGDYTDSITFTVSIE